MIKKTAVSSDIYFLRYNVMDFHHNTSPKNHSDAAAAVHKKQPPPEVLDLSDITPYEQALTEEKNYIGSSDEDEYSDENDGNENVNENKEQENEEELIAKIPDPLNNRLSSQDRKTLKAALNHRNKPIKCPWYPTIDMYDWVALVMGMFDLQFKYFEEQLLVIQYNRAFIEMNGQMRRKIIAEIKNLAVICFAAAVFGYNCDNNVNPLIMRGGKITVLQNQKFYDTFKDLDYCTKEIWCMGVINPIARWMTKTFKSSTIRKLHSKPLVGIKRKMMTSQTGHHPFLILKPDASNGWFNEDDLKNTKGGECALSYFNERFSLITKNCTNRTKIDASGSVFFQSALIIQRLGVDIHKWPFDDTQLEEDEQQAWIDLGILAWKSERAVIRAVNRYKEIPPEKLYNWRQKVLLENHESEGAKPAELQSNHEK